MKSAVVAVLYILTARLGFLTAIDPGNVTVVWIPSGLALAALLFFGRRLWPGIWIGSFIVNAGFFNELASFSFYSFMSSFGIATGSTLQALLGVFFIRRWIGSNDDLLDRSTNVFKFFIIEVFSCFTAATFGVISLCLARFALWSSFSTLWRTWWLGDLSGVIVVTPLLLTWSSPREFLLWKPKQFLEFTSILFLLMAACRIIFETNIFNPLVYVLILFVIWAAFRFGKRGVAATVFLTAVLAIWGTVHGFGPFMQGNLSESLIFLQIFVMTLTMTGFALAAAIMERKNAEKATADLAAIRGEQATALESSNKRLKELSAMKDEFMATVSHELRTPLAALKEGTALLLDKVLGPINEEQRDFLMTIDESVDRLTSLINNMLDISKIEANRLRLSRRRISIDELIQKSVRQYKAILAHRTVKMDLAPAPDVFVDPNRISQVIDNLLSNAVKFSPDGGVIIFKTREVEGHVVVSIQDNGRGISAEDIPKLFQKFSQVGLGKDKPSGTGLGLMLCKQLVEMHKGAISVSSQEGAGAEFFFTLPIYSWQLELEESFRDQLKITRQYKQDAVVMVALDIAHWGRRSEELIDFLHRYIHHTDSIIPVKSHWLVIIAASDPGGGSAMIEQIKSALNLWIQAVEEGRFSHLSVNIGTAVYPRDGADAMSLFARATASVTKVVVP